MKIIPDYDICHDVLCESDKKLFQFISKIPYFVRRFFIVEFESAFESQFIDFYTRVGFGEFTEAQLVKCKLETLEGAERVLLCNFIHDGTTLAEEVLEYLQQYEWTPKKPEELDQIDLYDTVFGQNAENSSIKTTTLNELQYYEGEFSVEACEDLHEARDKQIAEELERKKEERVKISTQYDQLSVDFLGE